MPCSVPSTSVSKARRLPSPMMSPPRVVALLDLSNAREREVNDFIRRTHTGRWPTWRTLGMLRVERTLYEAAEWLRHSKHASSRFSVLEHDLDSTALHWRDYPSAAAARAALTKLAPRKRVRKPLAAVAATAVTAQEGHR